MSRRAISIAVGVDLCLRVYDIELLELFYTNQGLLSVRDIKLFYGVEEWLPMDFCSTTEQTLIVFIVGILCSFYYAMRFNRIALFTVWVVLTTIYDRNPFVNNYGDDMTRNLITWMLFIPNEDCKCGAGYLALKVQPMLVYFSCATCKLQGKAWVSSNVVAAVLSSEPLCTPIGKLVLYHTPSILLQYLTSGTLLLQTVAPFALALPRTRKYTAAILLCMHISFAICLNLGFLFSVVYPIALLIYAKPQSCKRTPCKNHHFNTSNIVFDSVCVFLLGSTILLMLYGESYTTYAFQASRLVWRWEMFAPEPLVYNYTKTFHGVRATAWNINRKMYYPALPALD